MAFKLVEPIIDIINTTDSIGDDILTYDNNKTNTKLNIHTITKILSDKISEIIKK